MGNTFTLSHVEPTQQTINTGTGLLSPSSLNSAIEEVETVASSSCEEENEEEENEEETNVDNFWDNRENDHFTCWNRAFTNFQTVIMYCVNNKINYPTFEIVSPGNGRVISMRLNDCDNGCITISDVTYTDERASYNSLTGCKITYDVNLHHLSSDVLLYNVNELLSGGGVIWVTNFLPNLFMEMPYFDDNFTLVDQHKAQLYQLTYESGIVALNCCFWCGANRFGEVCDACKACLSCSSNQNLLKFDNATILCESCYSHYQLVAKMTGGKLGPVL